MGMNRPEQPKVERKPGGQPPPGRERTGFRLAWVVAGCAAAALGVSGCGSTAAVGRGASGPRGEVIQEINLLSAPAALNFDGVPGPDGLSLRIYAGNAREPKCLAIRSGALEILMFDGMVSAADLATAVPRHVWSYPAGELGRYSQKTSIGFSYLLSPLWGRDKPTKNRVTVVARHRPVQGPTISSAPTVVFVPGS
jgi:hypothetical protein